MTSMTTKQTDTRSALLNAACQLFAKHGYSSVSTRMITELAGVAHSSIHYHFDTKEALYTEVFRQVFDFDNALDYEELMRQEPYVLKTPEGKSYAIHRIVRDYFKRNVFFRETWQRELVIREMYEHSAVYVQLTDTIFRFQANRRREFFHLLKPDATPLEAYFWGNIPESQGLLYLTLWPSTEQFHDADFMEELKEHVIKTTSIMMIQLLDLPIPEMLR